MFLLFAKENRTAYTKVQCLFHYVQIVLYILRAGKTEVNYLETIYESFFVPISYGGYINSRVVDLLLNLL